MTISGPFPRKGRPGTWYLSYFVPRRNADGTSVMKDGKPVLQRHRPMYPSKAAAEADKPRILEEHGQSGASAFVRSREAAAEYDRAKKIEDRVPLDECARFYRLHHPVIETPRVSSWVTTFLADVQHRLGEGRHHSDLKSRLTLFAKGFGSRIPETITRPEIMAYLKALPKKGRTVLNHKRALCNFFNWLRDQPGSVMSHNPAGGIKRRQLPKIDTKEIGFLELPAVERYLRAAERYDPELVAHEVVQLIAGVRADDEMDNFDGEFVKPATKEVVIPAAVAKTGVREVIIGLEENFWAWWKAYGRRGRLRPQNYGPRWDRLRVLASIVNRAKADELARLPIKTLLARPESKAARKEWPWTARRRTFATYHVAKHQSADKTALIMRHRGDTYTLHNSYRGTGVTPETGAAYFSLMPKPVAHPIRPEVVRRGIVRIQFDKRRSEERAS